jgi:hypothetical protein
MTEDSGLGDGPAPAPTCPGCRQPIRANLRQEPIVPQGAAECEPAVPVTVTYCGNCGLTLHVTPAAPGAADDAKRYEGVAPPADEQTADGQFQLRCRELIGDIRSLGFDPFVWVAQINSLGAAAAAKKFLADHHGLAATPWLVRRGRPDLTMEHEIGQPRWTGIFTAAERAEAAKRLALAGNSPGAP